MKLKNRTMITESWASGNIRSVGLLTRWLRVTGLAIRQNENDNPISSYQQQKAPEPPTRPLQSADYRK